jgi:cell division control protein 6
MSSRKMLLLYIVQSARTSGKQDTNRAYSEVSASGNMLLRGVSKSTFFQSVNYLQNLGLITLIKKKIGRYYTMESQILLSDESIVLGELRKRV